MRLKRKSRRRPIGFILVFILLASYCSPLTRAQEPGKDYRIGKQYLFNLGNDFTSVISSPLRWKTKDLLLFSAIMGTSILIFSTDGEIQNWVQENRNTTSDRVSDAVTYLGHGAFATGLIAVLYASGEVFQDRSLRKTALLSLESFIISSVIVNVLKISLGRARPYTAESSGSFHPFSIKSRYRSFPSGHAATAFALASTIADQTESTVVDVLSYSLAAAAALSRIHDNKHWMSDVFIGSAIGYFVGKKICSLDKKKGGSRVDIGFQFSSQRQMLIVSFSF